MQLADEYGLEVDDDAPISFGSISLLKGDPVTLWLSAASEDTEVETRLCLHPDRPAIIGRARGGEIEYLDPSYRPTPIVPGTGQTVLQRDGQGDDIYVSRGHFMLRAVAGGILLVNGVPRRGGGIRPPLNGTWMVRPRRRQLAPAEEYQIEGGCSVTLWLPNGSEVLISAG